ncbi:hypothetical protein STRDD10_01614 [Streptococcus sp. DD10]|uniref:hypothetical protein n=1 Tax=Streptococcus sp. DD10 TaxID=1777878 RepID=UPI00079C4253|nr:hypothetical protein [Streptococcus sp. DD10]KXT73139.1 hypothetical protein STRDD10_01614 [Streptococcus sp. DD10]
MDWNQLLISTIPAVISSIATYLLALKQSKSEIAKLKEQHEHEFQMLKENTQSQIDVLKAQAETTSQAELTNSTANFMFTLLEKAMTGEIDLENLKNLKNLG